MRNLFLRGRLRLVGFASLVLLLFAAFDRPALSQQAQVEPATAIILARTTIVALNHANRTGNYAVFRDLGSPSFSSANTPAKLAVLFSEIRDQDLDMSPVVLIDPQFTIGPAIDQAGRLRMAGFFPTQPIRISFDMLFENSGNKWKLFGISIKPVELTAQPQATAPQQPAGIPEQSPKKKIQ